MNEAIDVNLIESDSVLVIIMEQKGMVPVLVCMELINVLCVQQSVKGRHGIIQVGK